MHLTCALLKAFGISTAKWVHISYYRCAHSTVYAVVKVHSHRHFLYGHKYRR